MYYLSVCAIVKNEAPYIEEWIEFHLLQGVGHFYLYDNESTDDTLAILDNQYKDVVTIIDWPGSAQQLEAYEHAIKRCKDETHWMAFIDCDEFLYATGSTISRLLNNLSRNHFFSGLAVNWTFYGSNGHEEKPEGLVIENFTRRQNGFDQHVKSIIYISDPDAAVGNNPHAFKVREKVIGGTCVLSPLPKEYALNQEGSIEHIRINHYHTKSKAEARERWKLPRADCGSIRDFEVAFPVHDLNEVEDLSAAKFAEQVKENIKKRRCQI